tara:strand:- start:5 stop:178 length:174 start_codon:yes stop_codon:yes gene_type:complete
MKKLNLVQQTLRLNPKTIKEVKKIAQTQMRSFNQMVNIILADFVKETKDKFDKENEI